MELQFSAKIILLKVGESQNLLCFVYIFLFIFASSTPLKELFFTVIFLWESWNIWPSSLDSFRNIATINVFTKEHGLCYIAIDNAELRTKCLQ